MFFNAKNQIQIKLVKAHVLTFIQTVVTFYIGLPVYKGQHN